MFQHFVLSHGHKINWKMDPKLTVSMDVSRQTASLAECVLKMATLSSNNHGSVRNGS